MARGKVGMLPGSVAPAQYGPWAAVAEKLEEAQVALLRMRSAKDRVEFERGFVQFAAAIEVFWQRFNQEGKARFLKFGAWVQHFNQLRKTDELLLYFLEVRHVESHGSVNLLNWPAGVAISVGYPFGGTWSNVVVRNDGTYEDDSRPADLKMPTAVFFDPGVASLREIVNANPRARGDGKVKVTLPPKTHQGTDISGISPVQAANAIHLFYAHIFMEALAKFPG